MKKIDINFDEIVQQKVEELGGFEIDIVIALHDNEYSMLVAKGESYFWTSLHAAYKYKRFAGKDLWIDPKESIISALHDKATVYTFGKFSEFCSWYTSIAKDGK